MAHRPVGTGTSISTSSVATSTTSFSVQSDVLRIVALGANAFVAIGTDPTATLADYLIPSGTSATLALTKASQRVVGIITGTIDTGTIPTSKTVAPGSLFQVTDFKISRPGYQGPTGKARRALDSGRLILMMLRSSWTLLQLRPPPLRHAPEVSVRHRPGAQASGRS